MTNQELKDKFLAKDRELSRLDSNLEYEFEGYVPQPVHTDEYLNLLKECQDLYKELENRGINPF